MIRAAIKRFYTDRNPAVAIGSKALLLAFVIWALLDMDRAGPALDAARDLTLKYLHAYYMYASAFFAVTAVAIAVYTPFGKIKLGDDGGRPEFSTFSWLAMMFSAAIGSSMLAYSVAEPLSHFSENPVLMESEQALRGVLAEAGVVISDTQSVFAVYKEKLATGEIEPGAPVVEPRTAAAVESAIRYTFLHWGPTVWGIYTIIGVALAYFGFRRGLPLTVRSGLSALFGRAANGPAGVAIDIAAVLSTILGVSLTIGIGANAFVAGLYKVTGAGWLMTTDGATSSPTIGAQLLCLLIIMILATLSAVSGVGRGIKWLSNLNIVLSFGLLAFFLVFGSTLFALELYWRGVVSYVMHLPALTFTVFEAGSEQRDWQSRMTVYYWAWTIAYAAFVGIFLARISKNRSIREFVVGAMIVPVSLSFLWFCVAGGSAIDLELKGVANGDILNASLTRQLFETLNFLVSAQFMPLLSMLVTVLLLIYLVTSVDSAILMVNTIAAGGAAGDADAPSARNHIYVWAALIASIVGALLMAGGFPAIQSAMIVGAAPFSLVILLTVVGLLKALVQEKQASQTEAVRTEK